MLEVVFFQVPQLQDPQDKQLLILGGILNIIFPCGSGALVCGIATKNKQLVRSGVFQLLSIFIFIGGLWSMIYGFLMIVQGLQTSEHTPRAAPTAGGTCPPAPATVDQKAVVDVPVAPAMKGDTSPMPSRDLEAGPPLPRS